MYPALTGSLAAQSCPSTSRARRLIAPATLFALVCSMMGLAAAPAHAAYPDHALRLIVPFAPGGAVDGAARPAAIELGKALGQSVVVDNRPGAGGTIGIQAAEHAAPDGYTLLLGNIALASAPALYPQSNINPKDFAPVALVGTTPYVLLVRADSPIKTVAELIENAKSHPGKMNYSSAGTGSAIHLAGELFKAKAGVDVVHVPYKGASPALTALLGGEVDLMFSSTMEAAPMLSSGKVRALAVTSAERTSQFPNVPTLTEAGLKGYQVTGWYGVYVQANVPPDVLKALQQKAQQGLRSDDMRKQLANYGLEAAKGDATEAQKMLDDETARWSEVIKNANIKAN
ncbi:tripartite tricarboxylate transporter substrate binding protein [Bordetella sp. LUAb4]|uniref:Bug family tripartite tricarboxylate transporter substrate binding protein n=1 Tax=Bordetella sp. LUAb4 TaxID=2843195 RepID=UPI001E3159B5|nr:tripartite tricarboxylate transporter substrate binding protein [Bordetella sp. LUAb4]